MGVLADLGGEQARVGPLNQHGNAQGLGVIGDDEPVQGTHQLRGHPGCGDDLLALGELVRLARSQRVAHQARVVGVRGMQVGVTPEDTIRVVVTDEGRVVLFQFRRVATIDGEIGPHGRFRGSKIDRYQRRQRGNGRGCDDRTGG